MLKSRNKNYITIPKKKNYYCFRFKMNVILVNCTQIKEWNEIIIRHNIFTKLLKKKTNLKLLCERKVGVFIEDKIGRKKLKLYCKCKVTFILKQIFLAKMTLIVKRREYIILQCVWNTDQDLLQFNYHTVTHCF